ncbi:Gfo/Idh/MocA family protein [Chromobacterium violaceum]|uniref:Gfo/Idh/MocA family oxidoreductase n=2 Tax=Chromobacterium violaceum TaxID=536 RepID=A0A1R0MDC5_CHRVL|nr:Gfo/Idh/MocA family oxidoreductase [Chromobacterium violaceum]AAQ59082.1 probable dehydrogenase [Chromobacterium violaceum ATCC 12472]ATP28070.1 gfo/Idh/MocA family oxidoreductase [Chromobacterium violaceum]ATP31980.1 gfo/Idh/MocA family oxidoreductase [Chromobacterium violaceum]KMN48358.1 dehydrogenase [Chromobacterium violaceum]KMN84745.1 dehydrogenase [Chromobacterium violaceum]
MSLIKVGLVGIGAQMQENLLPSLLQMQDIRIVAACDSDLERARRVHRFISDIPVLDNVPAMLNQVPLDAVVMAGPPQLHFEMGLLAMSKGVNVFVEKPPCATLEELETLIDAARRSDVVSGVGMNFKFARPVRQLREMTQVDEFGETLHIQLNHYANKPRAPLWGLDSTLRSFLLAQAIHTIDLAITFGDGELRRVQSSVQRHDDALIVKADMAFSSGATASLLAGTSFPYFEFDMKLVSSSSTLVELDNLWNITLHEPEHATRPTGAAKRWRGAWQPGPLDSGYERSGYHGELHQFFQAIREHRRFEADFASLLPTYRVIEEICSADAVAQGLQNAHSRIRTGIESLSL